uniref:Uncharacterized protein n=1 Tax=Pristionchus pacificus TaxID=54126 RepID=A0A2A6BJH3_PRIPA|eukprot:PDM66037.1 hypothetical protein PRIPAC_45262 [Pristionchus pacificus]
MLDAYHEPRGRLCKVRLVVRYCTCPPSSRVIVPIMIPLQLANGRPTVYVSPRLSRRILQISMEVVVGQFLQEGSRLENEAREEKGSANMRKQSRKY